MKKKIIFVLPGLLCFALFASAQYSNAPASGNAKSEPTVNGKPYSQYKAEQDALKRQIEAQKNAVTKSTDMVFVNAADAKPVPAKPAVLKPDNDGGAKPMPIITEQAVVGTKKTDAPTPEAFKMPTQEQWQTMGLNKPVVETAVSTDPSAKQSRNNTTPVEVTAQPTPAGLGGDINATEKPQPAMQHVKETEKPKQPGTTPEVPAQFRLPADASWGNATTTEMPVRNNVTPPQIKDNPAQSVKAEVVAAPYKTPAVKESNNSSDDHGKTPASKPAEIKVETATTKKAANPAPEVPAQLRLPAAQSWDGKPVTPAAPVNQATEKPAVRTAAEIEAAKAAQQQADDKSKKPAMDASKAAVQEVKVARQETASTPKKD